MSVNVSFTNSHITPHPGSTLSAILGRQFNYQYLGVWLAISAVDANVITATRYTAGYYGYFATDAVVGAEVLIHHSLCKSTSPSDAVKTNLGKWEIRRITAVSGNNFTLDKAPDIDLTNFYVQAAVIQEIENLTLSITNYVQSDGMLRSEDDSGYEVLIDKLMPSSFDATNYWGGILAVRIWDTLTLDGGHIDLYLKGLTTSTLKAYRPITLQEQSGSSDTQLYSGCENSICKDCLPINYGDGALFLIAKNIVVSDSSSRIGNPNLTGYQYRRNAIDTSSGYYGNTVGGSSLFIACNNFTGFAPAIISKCTPSTSGKGLGRAYIATGGLIGSILADEGLYALDSVQNSKRLNSALNVKNFGRGEGGNGTNTSSLLATYSVSAVSSDKKTFTCSGISTVIGRLVMVHQLQKTAGANLNSGKFYLARIVSYNSSAKTMTLDFACDVDPANYYVQIIPLKEFEDLTINGTVKGQAWSNGTGGILPIVCNGTLNLCGGFLDVRGCGTKTSITNALVGNNFMRSRLYIGQGHGTVFILARKILMNSATRIGSNSDGANFGGKAYHEDGWSAEGGYAGKDGGYHDSTDGTYSTRSPGKGGWGGGAGANSYGRNGGWHGNAPGWNNYVEYDYEPYRSLQGAHILIVSDSIDGFNLHAISTGGEYGDGRMENGNQWWAGTSGGAGYGGGGCSNGRDINDRYNYGGAGGYRGGGGGTANQSEAYEGDGAHIFFGGGGAGNCFVYCNEYTNQDTTGIVTS